MSSKNELNTFVYKEGKWSLINARTLFNGDSSSSGLAIAMELKLTD